ncbi:hypothetical protein [Propionivibrio soli]|uniref:hypothetical protein n=1 Tax=Propionivibrio soli TaxID=2976531 RepID=UPI0021E81376|nr:hypothetical protein [Propionivibrio soli]
MKTLLALMLCVSRPVWAADFSTLTAAADYTNVIVAVLLVLGAIAGFQSLVQAADWILGWIECGVSYVKLYRGDDDD